VTAALHPAGASTLHHHAGSPALRPGWLRPAALAAALAAHGALVGSFLVFGEPPSAAYDSYDISYVQEGEAAPAAQADSTPDEQMDNAQSTIAQAAAEAQADEAPKVNTLAKTAPLALEKPETLAPDAIVLAQVKKREEDPLDPTQRPQTEPLKPEQEQRPDDTPTEKVAAERHVATEAAEAIAAAAAAERNGTNDARNVVSSAARARYGAKVLAEIQKHMFYPRPARSAGVTGAASIVFTVGAEGRIVERRIERSTGNAELDHAALAMMDAVIAPPPPLGRFLGKTTIRFDIKR